MSEAEIGKRPVVVWPQSDVVRRVVLDGVEVVLERRGGVWAVADEDVLVSEAALLGTLGQPTEALGRAKGVVAALNAQLVRPDQLSGLVRRLAWLWIREPHRYWCLGVDERDALALACVHLGSDAAWEFLVWALAKRLESALWRTPWVPPGPHGWAAEAVWEFDHGIDSRLGSGFFDALEAHPQERFRVLAVATDPAAGPSVLSALAAERDLRVLELVAVNPATPIDALEEIIRGSAPRLRGSAAQRVRLRVLQNPSVPGWLISQAALTPSGRSEPSLVYRTGSAESAQRVWAVMHPRVPKRLLRALASCEDPQVRAAVARSVRTPQRVLEALAPGLDAVVRAGVARNPTAASEMLVRLGGDPHRSVRAATAANPAAPPAVLERLAGDRVASVRHHAADNEATPSRELRALCDDADVLVAAAAAANPATVRSEVCTVAARLARSDSWHARRTAAGLAETPAELLDALAADPHRGVRLAAAANLRTPRHALDMLAQRAEADQDLDALIALIDNDAVDGELRARVADACRVLHGPPPQLCMTPADERRWAQP